MWNRLSAGGREPGPRFPWIRLALFDKKLTVIVDHLMSNCRYQYISVVVVVVVIEWFGVARMKFKKMLGFRLSPSLNTIP